MVTTPGKLDPQLSRHGDGKAAAPVRPRCLANQPSRLLKSWYGEFIPIPDVTPSLPPVVIMPAAPVRRGEGSKEHGAGPSFLVRLLHSNGVPMWV